MQARENLNFSLTFGDTNVEEILAAQRIKVRCCSEADAVSSHPCVAQCMASGAAGPRKKYYFYAREKNTGAPFLMEIFVLSKDREMATEIRCRKAGGVFAWRSSHLVSAVNSALLPDFVQFMKNAMRPFSRISGVQG